MSAAETLNQGVGHTAGCGDLKELGLTRGDLMMEAISVFKETGLTPRQLADENKEKQEHIERLAHLIKVLEQDKDRMQKVWETLTSQRNDLLAALEADRSFRDLNLLSPAEHSFEIEKREEARNKIDAMIDAAITKASGGQS